MFFSFRTFFTRPCPYSPRSRGFGRRSPAACILNSCRLHGHLGDNRKSHSCDLVLVTGGTVFTDQLDIKLQCRVTLPGGTLLNQWLCNEACLMARIQSVAYDQIRSKSLITDHMTSDFDRERLPSGAFIYSN